jgi:hypothetical protein
MKAILERLIRIAEIVFTALATFSLLPVLFLIVADLASGTSSTPRLGRDSAWAFGILIGLVGVWVALLIPDSRYQRNPGIRWAVVAALAIATALLVELAWGMMRFGAGMVPFSIMVAAAGVGLHHFARLIMLSKRVAEPHDSV